MSEVVPPANIIAYAYATREHSGATFLLAHREAKIEVASPV